MMTYRQHKATSRYRGIEHALTKDQYEELITQTCVYCGGPGGGIDRLDPKQGYLPYNCAPACKRCNARKSIYESLGVNEAIEKAVELAHRNNIPPPSEREWRK